MITFESSERMIGTYKVEKYRYNKEKSEFETYYENKEYDFDRYNFIKKRPLSTHETSVVVDFKRNEITGDTIAYGTWYDIELQECIEYLKTLQPSEIKRDFKYLIVQK
ncbi:hypothetical protein OB986_27120 [Bacillus cereus]|nr:hypothetical protein [Bacillus cereus]